MSHHKDQNDPLFEHAECVEKIKNEANTMTWMHLIAFVALFAARLNDLFTHAYETMRSEEEEKKITGKLAAKLLMKLG